MLTVSLVTRFLMVAPGSDRGITFSLKPECWPTSGGSQLTTAFSPVCTLMLISLGGSGAVVMLAVHVSQSEMEELE